MNLQSPRVKWIVSYCNSYPLLDVGFAGSETEPDELFSLLRQSARRKQVIGIDINQEKVINLQRPHTVVGSGSSLPIVDNSVKTVLLAEVIEHIKNPFPFFLEAYRVLDKQGKFILTTPNPYSFFSFIKHYLFSPHPAKKQNVRSFLGYHEHCNFYDPLSVINLLYESGFSTVSFTTKNFSLPYLPAQLRELSLDIWPFNRFGAYSCFVAKK